MIHCQTESQEPGLEVVERLVERRSQKKVLSCRHCQTDWEQEPLPRDLCSAVLALVRVPEMEEDLRTKSVAVD